MVFIGKSGSFVADRDGVLSLIVNDDDTDNNDGSFIISYTFGALKNGQGNVSSQVASANLSFIDFERMLKMSETQVRNFITARGFEIYIRKGKMPIYIKKDKNNIEKSEFIYFGHIRDSQKIRVVYATDNETHSEKMFNEAFSSYKKNAGKLEDGYYWCVKPGKVFLRISPTRIQGPGISELYPWEFEFSDYYD